MNAVIWTLLSSDNNGENVKVFTDEEEAAKALKNWSETEKYDDMDFARLDRHEVTL